MADAQINLHAILSQYDLAAVETITEAGGTAGKTWRVAASCGDYFLRLRGVRTSAEARLEFDHGLRDHLVAQGVPTAGAVRTRDGRQWVRNEEGVYELYPFVVGRSFNPDSEQEVGNAAQALAEFHKVAAEYRPPSPEKEPIAQYTTLGFSDEVSDRMDDPSLQRMNMVEARALAGNSEEEAVVDRCLSRAEGMAHTYAGAAFDGLCGWVIHGDYTPANLLFSEDGNVVGIFDLDWALPGARCRDVADGLYFFATKPREIESSDIWSLTDAAEFDPDRCTAFLQAYQGVAPLAPQEIDAIPQAFTGRWVSIRLEGMAKVDKAERFRFFSRDIEKPLLWLDEHWPHLKQQIG